MPLILLACLPSLPSASDEPCKAFELCNDLDDDCDGAIDESPEDGIWWGLDEDEDGYGSAEDPVLACSAPPTRVPSTSDCDDSDPEVNPGAEEHCNDLDDDCDDEIDEDAIDAPIWYVDDDGDDWGAAEDVIYDCAEPWGYTDRAGDCEDHSSSIHPEADEYCNGIDDDCDEAVDEDAVDADSWWVDADGDGYGDPDKELLSCSMPTATVDNDEDCDDGDKAVNPGTTEECNAVDDDCSGWIDDNDACSCDTHWNDDGDPYLFCIDLSWEWFAAQKGCASVGYHLVTIDDGDENDWVTDVLETKRQDDWWSGYNDRDKEDHWVWEDGSSSTYTNWADDQPNDWGLGQDCMELFSSWTDTWNDADCDSDKRFICELD
ncbi:MAG TPA: MopE-related protein [Myxococcota bacterium]|nr:MopE-related protein [Myxococcota bacterium]